MTESTAAADVAATPTLSGQAPFSRTALWVIGGLVLASMIAIVAMTVLGEDIEDKEPSAGPDGYSASAIGHRGLIKVLRELDIPVVVSQNESAIKAKDGLLVIAEPVVADEAAGRRLKEMIQRAPRVLLVLPKWWSTPATDRPAWVDDVGLVPTREIDDIWRALDLDVVPVERLEAGHVPGPASGAEADGLPAPTLSHTPQLLRDVPFEVRVTVADHALVASTLIAGIGERDRPDDKDTDADDGDDDTAEDEDAEADADGDGEPDAAAGRARTDVPAGHTLLTIVSDPDVLNNHGLGEGQNARFTVGLIDELRRGGPVVFDEVAHGYQREPSLWKLLFRYPLVLATLQAILCMLVVVLATSGRFGPPAHTPRAIAAGKDFLIRNTAALLRYGGHDAEALRRYLAAAVAHVRAVNHAPRDLPRDAVVAWLERIRVARNGTVSLPELERAVGDAAADPAHHKKIPEIAMRVHRWRQEMTHGSRHHT